MRRATSVRDHGFAVAVAGVEAKVFAAPNGKTFALIEDLPGSAKPPAPDPSAKPTTEKDAPSETPENRAGSSETPGESPPDEEAPRTSEEAPSGGEVAPPATEEAPPPIEEAPPAPESSSSGSDDGGG